MHRKSKRKTEVETKIERKKKRKIEGDRRDSKIRRVSLRYLEERQAQLSNRLFTITKKDRSGLEATT